MMNPFRHDLVNMLYTIKGHAESHLIRVEEGFYEEDRKRLSHAEEVLKKIECQSARALEMTKRIANLCRKAEIASAPPLAGPRNDSAGAGTPAGIASEAKSFGKLRIPSGVEGQSRVSLRRAWLGTMLLLSKEFDLRELEMLVRVPDDFPAIDCAPDELAEILYHVARNAVQALTGSGQRSAHSVQKKSDALTAVRCSLNAKLILRAQLAFSSQEEPFALLQISDTGPGIAPEDLSRIFHPFFTTKPEGTGNGLGLYLTKVLVEKNRGRIQAASFPGQGTTFTLEFPIST